MLLVQESCKSCVLYCTALDQPKMGIIMQDNARISADMRSTGAVHAHGVFRKESGGLHQNDYQEWELAAQKNRSETVAGKGNTPDYFLVCTHVQPTGVLCVVEPSD